MVITKTLPKLLSLWTQENLADLLMTIIEEGGLESGLVGGLEAPLLMKHVYMEGMLRLCLMRAPQKWSSICAFLVFLRKG